jgi:hypothetical protein
LAYIGIIFIVLGMATAVRMVYLIWFFGFGKRYFDYMKSKDEVLNQQEIKFRVTPYKK